ncbi:MAG TPA: hypothetical protein VH370_05905 [Humisphaera sp.]|jgi:hypothetical protein|nr:hypothetical protein [Humisphaera sp.]
MPDDENPTPPAGKLEYARRESRPRRRSDTREWFLGPVHPIKIAYLVIISAVLFWWARIPPTSSLDRTIHFIAALLACGPILLHLLIGLLLLDPEAIGRPSWRKVFCAAIALLVPIGMLTDMPLSIAFALSEQSMNRLASRVSASPNRTFPDQWVGFYFAQDIQAVPGGIFFRVSGAGGNQSGFCSNTSPVSGATTRASGKADSARYDYFRPAWSVWNNDW